MTIPEIPSPSEIRLYAGEIDPETMRTVMAVLKWYAKSVLSVPDGWKLVPIDPTEDMLIGNAKYGYLLDLESYTSVLDAAPQPPKNED